jgi:glycerol uptake facilitator-like aquaporin
VAQVLGAIAAGAVLYLIASGAPGFDVSKGFASNGYGTHSPGGYTLAAAALTEVVMTAFFLIVILGRDGSPRACRLCAHRHRPGADLDPPDQHPRHQHLGEPGAQHRRGAVCR